MKDSETGTADRRRGVPWLIRLVVLTVLVVVLVRVVDLPDLYAQLKALSLPVFGLVLAAALADKLVAAFKWEILLALYQVPRTRFSAYVATFRAKIFTLIAPSSLGADAYKAWFFRQQGAPLKPVVASIVVERGLGLLSSLAAISLLLSASIRPLELPHETLLIALGYLGFFGILLGIHWAIQAALRHEGSKLPNWIPAKLRRPGEAFLDSASDIPGKGRELWWYFLVSLLEKGFYGLIIWLSAQALGMGDLPLLFCLGATPLLAMLERLPISMGSIGLREGLIVALLYPYYPDTSQALAIAVTLRLTDLFVLAVSGLTWFVENPSPSVRDTVSAVESL